MTTEPGGDGPVPDPIPVCPDCEGEESEVLRTVAEHATVRCTACGSVRRVSLRRPRPHPVSLVLSHGELSWSDRMEAPDDESVGVGDEFHHDGHRYLVTALETHSGAARQRCPVPELKVLHAKRFDTVQVKVSLNEGENTVSLAYEAEPEAPLRIGQVLEVQGRLMRVKTMKSDQNRTVRRGSLASRSVRRAFCDPAPAGSVPGSILPGPRRRQPPVRGGGPRMKGRGPKGPARRGGSKPPSAPARTSGTRSPRRRSDKGPSRSP